MYEIQVIIMCRGSSKRFSFAATYRNLLVLLSWLFDTCLPTQNGTVVVPTSALNPSASMAATYKTFLGAGLIMSWGFTNSNVPYILSISCRFSVRYPNNQSQTAV